MTDYAARLSDPADPLLPILRAAKAWGGRPPSVLMGRPVVTTYFHNAGGQLVRSETVEWTPEDLQMAMALQVYEAGLCPGCSTPLSETTDPCHNPGEPAEYDEIETVLCRKCVVRQQVAKRYEDEEYSAAILTVVGVKAASPAAHGLGGEADQDQRGTEDQHPEAEVAERGGGGERAVRVGQPA